MARFKVGEENNFGGQGGSGYFSLKNDRDTAKVRFLYESIEDIEGFAVHQVELDGKKRYVNCLREYGAPVDDCPFCKAKMFTTAKYFIPLWNEDEQRTQIWERGKTFGSKLSSLCSRYPNLVSQAFEIERNGKPRDTNTTYEIYPVGSADGTRVDDFDEVTVLGGVLLDKNASDMEYYLNNGTFADGVSNSNGNGGQNDFVPRRRTPDRTNEERF